MLFWIAVHSWVIVSLCGLIAASYSLFHSRMPAEESGASPPLSKPFTQSRMVQRAASASLFMLGLALFFVLIALSLGVGNLFLASETGAARAAAFLQADASRHAAVARRHGAAPQKLQQADGGATVGTFVPPADVQGDCGASLAGGALNGALAWLGAAELVVLYLLAIIAAPLVCPCWEGERVGEHEPVTVKLPLREAPAGLIWPPELRESMQRKLDISTGQTYGGAELDPDEEVEVEAWWDPHGGPREEQLRDTLLEANQSPLDLDLRANHLRPVLRERLGLSRSALDA